MQLDVDTLCARVPKPRSQPRPACRGWWRGARRPLSFAVSLLLALLRKKLAEFDAAGGDTRLILSREQVIELRAARTEERIGFGLVEQTVTSP